MSGTQASQSQELVFCHQCDNEWYRHEHGIICPECNSDFTEIIESANDPRQVHPTAEESHGFYAPDPDEADIDDFEWHDQGSTGSFARNTHANPNTYQGDSEGGFGAGLMGLIGPALQGVFGAHGQGMRQNQHAPEQDLGAQREGSHSNLEEGTQHQGRNHGTFVRHASGPGYSFTITTTSNSNLFPRDANGPQPRLDHPEHLERMMTQMFANIGVMPGPGFAAAGAPGGFQGGPIFMGVGGGPHGGGFHGQGVVNPMDGFFQMLGLGQGGVHGDAVYSQEGLDRIISQLMEQHRSGNAPPPASPAAIESLPKRPITPKDQGDGGKADCSICMDEAELGSMVTELPCGHWFHYDCIKAWLGEHDTCPHCRKSITPKDSQGNDGRARQPSQAPLHDVHRDQFGSDGNSSAGERGSGSSSQRDVDTSGGLFSRLRQTFSPGASGSGTGPGSGSDPSTR